MRANIEKVAGVDVVTLYRVVSWDHEPWEKYKLSEEQEHVWRTYGVPITWIADRPKHAGHDGAVRIYKVAYAETALQWERDDSDIGADWALYQSEAIDELMEADEALNLKIFLEHKDQNVDIVPVCIAVPPDEPVLCIGSLSDEYWSGFLRLSPETCRELGFNVWGRYDVDAFLYAHGCWDC